VRLRDRYLAPARGEGSVRIAFRPTDAPVRVMDWVGNARHNVALLYNYWTQAEWHGAFEKMGLSVSSWESDLELYPFPADLIFDRSLHFIAALRVPTHGRGN